MFLWCIFNTSVSKMKICALPLCISETFIRQCPSSYGNLSFDGSPFHVAGPALTLFLCSLLLMSQGQAEILCVGVGREMASLLLWDLSCYFFLHFYLKWRQCIKWSRAKDKARQNLRRLFDSWIWLHMKPAFPIDFTDYNNQQLWLQDTGQNVSPFCAPAPSS